MLDDLEKGLRTALDMDLFNAEADREQEESKYLDATRRTVADLLKNIGN
jgi:hypothetical protein